MTTPPCRLVVTPGEPAGIGPDICLALAQKPTTANLTFIADPGLLQQRAQALGYKINIRESDAAQPHTANTLNIIPVQCRKPVIAGKLDADNSSYVTETLDRACDLVSAHNFDALVTGPVHKGIINQAGIAFTGHTEWLAERTGCPQPVMMLANEQLRVALATTHLPLNKVSLALTSDHIETVIRILHTDLQNKFHISAPRIRICGLNPHAGEDGYLGREELEVIIPLINKLNQQGLNLEGPVPADTAFLPNSLDQTDAILAMYHDQGLPVLKYSGFETAVNITLGLPIIRTSVDHGTALELAGTGKASPSSLTAAISMATQMASDQQHG